MNKLGSSKVKMVDSVLIRVKEILVEKIFQTFLNRCLADQEEPRLAVVQEEVQNIKVRI